MSGLLAGFARLRERGGFHLLGANALAPLLGFATSLALARLLPAAEFGDVKVLQSYLLVIVIAGGAGLGAAVLKVCSEPREDEERRAFLALASRRALVSTGLALLAVLLLTRLAGLGGSPRVRSALPVYCLVLPFLVLSDLRINFLNGMRRFREMALGQVGTKAMAFALVVLAAWRLGFAGFVLATIAAGALGLGWLRWLAGPARTPARPIPLPPHFREIALLSVLGNGVDVLGQNADIFLLDHLVVDRASIGYYSLATLFLVAAMQVTATVQSLALPYLSAGGADRAWVRGALLRTLRRSFALGLVVAATLGGGAWVLIPRFFGPDFAPALGYLAILILKYLIYSVSAITGITLFSLGLVRWNLVAAVASTVVSFALCALLVPRLGVSGAAWSQVCAAAVTLLLQIWFCALALGER